MYYKRRTFLYFPLKKIPDYFNMIASLCKEKLFKRIRFSYNADYDMYFFKLVNSLYAYLF